MPYHLFICRHAQTQNPTFNQSDYERELTRHGQVEATQAGKWVQQLALQPHLIVCSSARRTLSTASIIAQEVAYNQQNIEAVKILYNASENQLLNYILQLNKDYSSVLLVGHNPGVSDLVTTLSGVFRGSVPTGSVHHLVFEIEDWAELAYATSKIYESNVISN